MLIGKSMQITNLLIYFESVYRLGAIRKSSKELNVSSATLSRAIDKLESELGFELFKKLGSEFKPTTEAVSLYNSVSSSIYELNLSYQQYLDRDMITIIAPSYISYSTFSNVISDYKENFNRELRVNFIHHFKSREYVYDCLRLGYVDYLVDFHQPSEFSLKSKVILDDELCAFTSKENKKPIHSFEDIEKLAAMNWMGNTAELILHTLGQRFKEKVFFATDNYYDYLDMIEKTPNTYGIGVESKLNKARFKKALDINLGSVRLYGIYNKNIIHSNNNKKKWISDKLSNISEITLR